MYLAEVSGIKPNDHQGKNRLSSKCNGKIVRKAAMITGMAQEGCISHIYCCDKRPWPGQLIKDSILWGVYSINQFESMMAEKWLGRRKSWELTLWFTDSQPQVRERVCCEWHVSFETSNPALVAHLFQWGHTSQSFPNFYQLLPTGVQVFKMYKNMGTILTQATTIMKKMELFLPSGGYFSWNGCDGEP